MRFQQGCSWVGSGFRGMILPWDWASDMIAGSSQVKIILRMIITSASVRSKAVHPHSVLILDMLGKHIIKNSKKAQRKFLCAFLCVIRKVTT